MLDILEGIETQTGIPMIARLVKPCEGYGRPVENSDGFDFACQNGPDLFMLEFYDARYPDAYSEVGINGAFVTRYDLQLFSWFDDDTPYIDLDSTDEYRFATDDFVQIIKWAEDAKPLMMGRTDEMAYSNCMGYATPMGHFMPSPEMSEEDSQEEEFPIPNISGNVQTLNFIPSALAKREYVSLGRNGWMKTIGVRVVESDSGFVSMIPVNSRDKSGRCEIQIPRDQGHLEAVIDMYQSILEEVKAGK